MKAFLIGQKGEDAVLNPDIAPGPVKDLWIRCARNGKMWITWSDPDDTAMSKWAGTKIVYKEGSFPENENDGTLVINNITKNAYSTAETALKIEGLENDKEYFVSAFPYSITGAVGFHPDNNSKATVTYSIGYIFGEPSSPAYAFGIVCIIPDIHKIIENGIAYADEIDGNTLKLCYNEYYYNADGSLDRWYQDRDFYGPNENNDLMCYIINSLYDQTDHFGIKVSLYDNSKKIRLTSNKEILIDKSNDSLVSPIIINSSNVLENGGISFNYMPSVPAILTINGRTILNGRYYIKMVRVNDGTETTIYEGLVSEETYTEFDYNFPSTYTGYIYLYPLAEVPANGSAIFAYGLKMLKSNIVPIIQFDWETATWEQVCQFLDIAKENNLDMNDYFSVGMTKDIDAEIKSILPYTMANPEQKYFTAKIVDINKDQPYSLTISVESLVGVDGNFSSFSYDSDSKVGSYPLSALATFYLNMENSLENISNIKNNIIPCNKQCYSRYGEKLINQLKFWPMSAAELSAGYDGVYSLAEYTEGITSAYKYYTNNNSRIKKANNSAYSYFTRTIYQNNNSSQSTVIYIINANGSLQSVYLPTSNKVNINFALGATQLDEEGGT